MNRIIFKDQIKKNLGGSMILLICRHNATGLIIYMSFSLAGKLFKQIANIFFIS